MTWIPKIQAPVERRKMTLPIWAFIVILICTLGLGGLIGFLITIYRIGAGIGASF